MSALRACSGAMYSAVPITTPATVRFFWRGIEAPGLGDPEVDELEDGPAPGERHEHVLGLQIAVHDAERVRGLEGLEDLHRVLACRADREPALPVDDAREGLALEQLHDDVGVPVRRAVHVDDLHDVGAPDLGDDARLLQEALDQAGPADELGVQDLDRHPRPEDGVERLVDGPHPAIAQDTDEPVLAVDDATDVNHWALEASLASHPRADDLRGSGPFERGARPRATARGHGRLYARADEEPTRRDRGPRSHRRGGLGVWRLDVHDVGRRRRHDLGQRRVRGLGRRRVHCRRCGAHEAAAGDAGTFDASGGPCPSVAPGKGSSCAREALECEYGTGNVPGCDTVATCDAGRWTVQAPTTGDQCPSTRPSGCPASFATATLAGHCEPLGLICDYPTGRCACTDGTGPIPLDASAAARWHCQEPGANCPRPRPPLGSACTSDGESCDYGSCTVPGGSGEACADGLWTTMPFACAL